jgi:hypothetical protein
MDDLRNPNKTDGVMSYRQMAARCRELAEISRRPGALLQRAEAYDACAEQEQLLIAERQG